MATKILRAMRLAEEAHRGQTRKGSGADYLIHPMMCTYILARFKRSKNIEDLICAMWLHDTVEDTDVTYERILQEFGPLVMSIVQELTNDEAEIARVGKLAYHKKKLVGISNYGLLGKLADRLHNIQDQPTPKYVADTIELLAHVRKKRKLTRPQAALVAEIEQACQQAQVA